MITKFSTKEHKTKTAIKLLSLNPQPMFINGAELNARLFPLALPCSTEAATRRRRGNEKVVKFI